MAFRLEEILKRRIGAAFGGDAAWRVDDLDGELGEDEEAEGAAMSGSALGGGAGLGAGTSPAAPLCPSAPDGETLGSRAGRHGGRGRSKPVALRTVAAAAMAAVCVAGGCALLLALLRGDGMSSSGGANVLRGPPAEAAEELLAIMDCSWIQGDDCVNQDIYACQCRAANPDGPCTACPDSKCKTGCCTATCQTQAAEEETQRAAEADTAGFNADLGEPSLFCFAVARPIAGGEAELLAQQQAMKAGIFACASYKVFSNEAFAIGDSGEAAEVVRTPEGQVLDMECEVKTFWSHDKVGVAYSFRLAINTRIFVTVWQWVLAHRYHESYDYTVKVDPDTVFVPPLLQEHFRDQAKSSGLSPEKPVFFNNCPQQDLHGQIEIVSKGGMRRMESSGPSEGIEACLGTGMAEKDPTNREDWFLEKCLQQLQVQQVLDGSILSEASCSPFLEPVPCNTGRLAFHPFKDWGAWNGCLLQAAAP